MPHPQYNGTNIPIFTIPPNWRHKYSLRTLYSTIIKEALSTAEERLSRRPRCLYGLRYQTTTLSGRETAYIRAVLEMAQAMPVGIPVWNEACRITTGTAAGSTAIQCDETFPTLWSVLPDYAYLVKVDGNGIARFDQWEVLEVETVGETSIDLAEPTTLELAEGDLIIPMLFGKLPRGPHKALTDENGEFQVDFEERFTGLVEQGITEEVAPPVLTVSYPTECRDELELSFPIVEGTDYTIQIATSAEGPWADHIFPQFTPEDIEAGLLSVRLNNDYRGDHWFRLVAGEEIVRSPVNPLASVIEPPDISVLNVGTSDLPMHGNGGFTYPYSQLENGWISPDDLYIVPRQRLAYTGPASRTIWEGWPQTVEITGEAGAVHKWTRDGNDPNENTVIQKLDGHEAHLAAYRSDFRFIIKARSFKNGCKSPITCFLVDRVQPFIWNLFSTGGSALVVAVCDLPKTINGVLTYTADGCVNGLEGLMLEAITLAAGIADAAEGHYAQRYYEARVDRPGEDLFPPGIEFYTYGGGGGSTGIGWTGWEYQTASGFKYLHKEMRISTANGLIQNTLGPCFFNAEIYGHRAYDKNIVEYIREDVYSFRRVGRQGVDDFATILESLKYQSDQYCLSEMAFISGNQSVPGENRLIITGFDLLFTLHDDSGWIDEPGFVVPEPEISEPLVELPPDIFEDNFESYSDAADATLVSLADGVGWNAAWVIHDYPITEGSEDWETYEDGEIEDTDPDEQFPDAVYEDGFGWADEWAFYSPPSGNIYGDDFEEYSDGNPFQIAGGSGWAPEGNAWEIFNYSIGEELFEDYTDGDATIQEMDSGTQWLPTPWAVFDYEP